MYFDSPFIYNKYYKKNKKTNIINIIFSPFHYCHY